jgi:hypothetical protein
MPYGSSRAISIQWVLIIHASVRGLHVLDNFLYHFFYLAFKLRGAKCSYIVEKTKASALDQVITSTS